MSTHHGLKELAEILVLGTLDPTDRERLDAHLQDGCDECEEVIHAASSMADQLVLAVPQIEPSPELRTLLLARAEDDLGDVPVTQVPSQEIRQDRSQRFARYALAASLVIATALGVRVALLSGALDEERIARSTAELALGRERQEKASALAKLAEAENARSRMDLELAAVQETIGHLTAERTRAVALVGQGELTEASARAYLDPESRRLVLFIYDLPPIPPGKSYQLWVIAEGKPVSAGVFDIDADGRTRFDTVSQPPLDGSVTIAVTTEPEGGLPQPSGPIVLVGT